MKTKKTLLKISLLFLIYIIYSGVNAQISFTDINPDTTIFHPDTVGGTNYYNLDLNNDGITDFKIGAEYSLSSEFTHRALENYLIKISTVIPNKVNVGPYFEGDTISPSANYLKSNWIYGIIAGQGIIGAWPVDVNSVDIYAYIGLEFNLNNSEYYGWVRLKTNGYSFSIDSYAWNNIPGQLIIVGQTE